MVKMASIVPQNYLEFTKEADFHMALACFVGEPEYERYTNFFLTRNGYCVLDNGVIEGQPMSIEKIVEKAELIQVDEIVLPDEYKDAAYTIALVQEAIAFLIKKFGEFGWPFKLMVVPQGLTRDEWLKCAKILIEDYGQYINTIGIPKHLIATLGERDARLFILHDLAEEVDLEGFEIHLLGCWKTPLEVLVCAKASEQGLIPKIRSCDSAIPYVYARNNMRFSDDDRPDIAPIDFKEGYCSELLLAYNIAAWNSIGDPNVERGIYFL